MNIGIVGLGLIGGSLAKAIKGHTDHTIFGYDNKDSVLLKAQMFGVIDGELTEENLGGCDLVMLALYPADTINYVQKHAALFRKGGTVLDCCGVKTPVCAPLFETAKQYDFHFVGGHPMAGLEVSGFDYSQGALFDCASMLLVPGPDADIAGLHLLKELFLKIGFSRVQLTTAEEHDQIIACTSQLAHIVSNAYVKAPLAVRHEGFSAGSFKDMTRVAKLNVPMWAELFLDNRENLIAEIEGLTQRLDAYCETLRREDREGLSQLLAEGNAIKLGLE